MARDYDEETKAAVMAALLAGQSISKVSDEFDVPRGTVYGWKRQIKGFSTQDVAAAANQKSDEIGATLLELVEVELQSLIQLSRVTQDPTWILEQPASELAVWMGVKHDKLLRMLDMFGQSEPGE